MSHSASFGAPLCAGAGTICCHAAPVEAVTRSKTPTLFIHGAQDNFVPANMMNKLYQAAACPKSFLWVPSADHATSVGTDPGLYWATVDTFLDTYFQQN